MSTLIVSTIFSDGLVLQRDMENKIYGKELGGNKVVDVVFDSLVYHGDVNENLEFEVILPPMNAGGPHTIDILGSEQIHIENVLIGDVFLLSGQSNMELPVSRVLDVSGEEIKQSQYPEIHQITLPMDFRFDEPMEILNRGSWMEATNSDIYNFSALGFFFAKEVHDTFHIPVGLVQTAIGGARCEAFMNPSILDKLGDYTERIKPFKDIKYFEEHWRKEDNILLKWCEDVVNCDEKEFVAIDRVPYENLETMNVPGMYSKYGVKKFSGSLIFYREFELIEQPDSNDAYIYLGAVVDYDMVWINGEKVGETEYKYPPRKYAIPNGVLRNGKNYITVRVEIFHEYGGFVEDMPYYIFDGSNRISIEGEWNYFIEKKCEPQPEQFYPPMLPVGLYFSSIVPLAKTSFKAVLWYQGESNDYHPDNYAELFEALVEDWRTVFQQKLKFFCVQLAKFRNPELDVDDAGYPEIRNQQRLCTSLDGVYLITAIDLGQRRDLHSQYKKKIAIRLFQAVKQELYGEVTNYEMPNPIKLNVVNDKTVEIEFEHLNKLVDEPIRGFELLMENGDIQPVNAMLHKNKVIIRNVELENVKSVRYDWNDCPETFDIVNEYGVLCGTFRLDLK